MLTQVLDLDGSLLPQQALLAACRPNILPLSEWGPRIRLACRFGRFDHFQQALADVLPQEETTPRLTFYGSGDFHHVSLALVRRLRTPFNLLVLDNHPDWMRAIPFLHCGTWLYHAARLPLVRHIFHVGGEVDFDNAYRWLAPWSHLRAGRIRVFPAVRNFRGSSWNRVPHQPLRPGPQVPVTAERLQTLLKPFHSELARWPLYISLDKDVMVATDAPVNWDSGHLRLEEVAAVLTAFLAAAQGRLAGMDVLGDWSPVRVQGLLRHSMHWSMHPPLTLTAAEATQGNEKTNLALVELLAGAGLAQAA